jgi:hypothetical protein
MTGTSPDEIFAVSDMLDLAFREVGRGHNGITVAPNDDDLRVDIDPWWMGDEGWHLGDDLLNAARRRLRRGEGR